MTPEPIRHHDLYRLPWTLPDNGISWLEPTTLCNLACDGCYRKNDGAPHKSFEQVKRELDTFQRFRKSDCISIAGGEPLVYPHIVDLVREISSRGLKAIINSNGGPLTRELLGDLKKAGVFGFTFHVDSAQNRPGWKRADETKLNELRLQFAELLAEAGDIACSFNATVYAENLEHVPRMISWAQEHIDIVQTMVFICFRHVIPDMPFEWYAGGDKVDWDKIWYHSDTKRDVEIRSTDLVRKVRESFPDFAPAAYLNGTAEPDAMKWLLTERIGTRDRIFGYAGAKFVELVTAAYHLRNGRYLSYTSPRASRLGGPTLLLGWPMDAGLRVAAKRYLGWMARNPLRAFRRVHRQTIMFIQPVDFMADGSQSMCDGCPDMTVHDGELVWSCRLEEKKAFGTFIRSVPAQARREVEPVGARGGTQRLGQPTR